MTGPVTVTIFVDETEDEIAQAPPGEVEFDFNLTDVPLEDSIAAEANVLVVMDDSGSMDWGFMTDQTDGLIFLSNAAVRDDDVNSYSWAYAYPFPTNSAEYGTYWYDLPTEEGLTANPDMDGNDYGVWRARNHQYNTIYYNPEIEYQPWIGLDRDGNDFVNAPPNAAPLDPFDVDIETLDLTQTYTFVSARVPIVHYDGEGETSYEDVTNTDVWFPYYYTTTAVGRPAWNDPHTKVEIRDAGATYTGGPDRADCAVDDANPLTCTYTQELQNFANWFSYYRIREYTAKAALGRSVSEAGNLRMGYAVLNKTSEREPIESLNASYRVGHKKDLMDQLYETPSGGGTPLRAALDRAGRHFECVSGDSFGSAASSEPGDDECPVLESPEGQCQNNFTLLFSDGTWNGSLDGDADADHDSEDGPSATEFDGGMFESSHSGSLADVAMYYYERDLHDLANGVPTTERDMQGAPSTAFSNEGETMHQHMKTYTVGFGVEGNVTLDDLPDDYEDEFEWSDPFNGGRNKIDDMLHAAVNGRGQFLQANNPVLLSQAFQAAFADFSQGSVSVSAVSFNSTSLREDTVLFNGLFNLKERSGDLQAVPIDIDTGEILTDEIEWSAAEQLDTITPNNRVIVTYDRVAQSGIPFRWASLNVDQKANLTEDEVNYLRGDRAEEEPDGFLRARAEDEGLLGDIVHSAPRFVGPPRALRRNQAPYPTDIGDRYAEFALEYKTRRRVVYVGANDGMLHGFDAGPSVADVGTGNELIGYVPNKFMDSTQRFASDLDELPSLVYNHKFYVDVTPETEDIFGFPADGATEREWHTVLIGAYGAGGKGYFALDITDPARYATEGQADDTVMWEFTDADDTTTLDGDGDPLLDLAGEPVKDLGYSFSQAHVMMTNAEDEEGNKRWASFFGNGYNSTAGVAKLFALFVEGGVDGDWTEGTDFVKVDTGSGVKSDPDPQAGLPNGLGTPALVDEDRNGTVDRVYAGDLFGTMWRFDVSSEDTADWDATPIFHATYDETTDTRQPITTRPVVFFNEPSGYLVIFGTGSYVTEEDGVSIDIQSAYGIWDRDELVPETLADDTKTRLLVEQTITNRVDEDLGDRGNLRVPSAFEVEYRPPSAGDDGVYGWYIDFDMERAETTDQGNDNPDTSGNATGPQFPGERAIRRIVVLGDVIVLTTVIPRNENSCFRAPPGAIMPVDWRTGGAPQRPVFDLNNDGVVDDDDGIDDGTGNYIGGGYVIPPTFCLDPDCDNEEDVVSSDVSMITDGQQGLLCTSNECITIEVLIKERTGRLSWRELPEGEE